MEQATLCVARLTGRNVKPIKYASVERALSRLTAILSRNIAELGEGEGATISCGSSPSRIVATITRREGAVVVQRWS